MAPTVLRLAVPSVLMYAPPPAFEKLFLEQTPDEELLDQEKKCSVVLAVLSSLLTDCPAVHRADGDSSQAP